ncbi:repressor LexA [Thermoanaerobacterium thermosaccharolyticum]|uniref:LexA repressor n=1 Tax=Thermoanaerobacterium thermosaccharolyticum TaxID=1517 RepID=A0A231VHA8_THETR|nr:transcriptional repressor LexA [Thermoanaerobacterium thermosaccharolyticum]TCW38612.1 SOS-response transcriptional repressor LexA [Thermohydrogenium kirishiense]AST59069.1 Xre family transcriptional regulator [Thermoanaerobacterium thermosaccharolyticum]KAA5807699.1 transcriptional repressor LexA [Thermoanaerobacterium thermosaccharolyticum]MBE0068095.1 transcriptional repressor LexA [Thermoanaerobacterium thermosaccharolyticum]MBE0227839.1 transcriptional repressor LexA [Thermoanaerobacte
MKDKSKISLKQQEIIEFIKSEINRKGYPPSVREIGKAVGLKSTSTVHGHLSRLEKKGYIRRDPTKPRAIEVLNNDKRDLSDVIKLPVIGKVTAGSPILAVENIDEYYSIPRDLVVGYEGESFILKVRGESMINAGILDGDYIIVRKQSYADNGDIIVALIEDEATVKRFYKESDHIRLQPENPSMDPIIVDNVMVLGKVVGVIRKLK